MGWKNIKWQLESEQNKVKVSLGSSGHGFRKRGMNLWGNEWKVGTRRIIEGANS